MTPTVTSADAATANAKVDAGPPPRCDADSGAMCADRDLEKCTQQCDCGMWKACEKLAGSQDLDPAFLKAYKWRSIGPARGGRSIAVSGVKGRPQEAYFGAAGGGLWKTSDGGMVWRPVTDGSVKSVYKAFDVVNAPAETDGLPALVLALSATVTRAEHSSN